MIARARRIVIDADLAEEAVQEAFTRAWRACSSFDPSRGAIDGWLLAITGNVAKDLVKARLRRPPLVAASASDAPAGHGGIDLVVLRAELRAALAGIAKHHRDALVETVLLDRSYTEVAAELGITPATLRTRVHYALRRMRAQLDVACS
jgi:RNA polymerase sigma-70 factor (ECF subfamily)